MADALISPAVGGVAWVASAALIGHCSRKLRDVLHDHKVPLMGVLGAFIFAAQMINFAIPGTGSSGHLGGGMVLSILLGPHAAFLTLASVLVVQALFFADGGLLALGCNILNMGAFPCFVAYPFIYRKLVGARPTRARIATGSIAASVGALQLGALCVVVETLLSGVAEIPMGAFLLLMQPIHLAIGIVEGLATAAVVSFVWQARPEILQAAAEEEPLTSVPVRRVLAALLVAAALTGGLLSWFASGRPDGLEWAIFRSTGQEEVASRTGPVHDSLAEAQAKAAWLPDYGFRTPEPEQVSPAPAALPVNAGTTLAGLVGGGITLALAGLIGLALKHRKVHA